MPLISIIIPVYNVENYIDECLQSIINQSFTDYQIILVDNASTDKSSEICDAYVNKYANIKVIHLKVNALPAGARNAGLDVASGEYIHFCDSDDYYVENSFLNIANILNQSNPNVLIGQFVCIPEKGAYVCNDIQLDPRIFEECNSTTIAEYLLKLPKLLCTPWRFIVSRALLIENNLKFIEGYHSEDEEWFPKVICIGEKFALLTEPFYCYRPRTIGSVTSVKTYLYSKSHLMVVISLLRFLREKQYVDARQDLILSRVKFLLGIFDTRCDTFDNNQIYELAGLIENNMEDFSILRRVSQAHDFYSLINYYGPHRGLYEYCINVVTKTLELVHGKENEDIYIFPTGYNGEGTARILLDAGYNVKGFFDNSDTKDGCVIDDLPVRLPKILMEFSQDKLENTFVMVSIQQEQIAKILVNQLKDFGLNETQMAIRIY